MKSFKNGVAYYTKGVVVIDTYFPEDDVCCFHCPMRYVDSGGRQMCRAIHKELYYVETGIHEECPIIWEDIKDETVQITDGE